jgi:hypothetical protein
MERGPLVGAHDGAVSRFRRRGLFGGVIVTAGLGLIVVALGVLQADGAAEQVASARRPEDSIRSSNMCWRVRPGRAGSSWWRWHLLRCAVGHHPYIHCRKR